jgi:hypothetical protein
MMNMASALIQCIMRTGSGCSSRPWGVDFTIDLEGTAAPRFSLQHLQLSLFHMNFLLQICSFVVLF